MDKVIASTWHHGELIVQRRAGTDQKMLDIGPKYVRDYMPQQHTDFFESLDMIFVGHVEQMSYISATILFGVPGFIQSKNSTELVINTQYSIDGYIHKYFAIGDKIGLLGLDFTTKRRNRVNVVIKDISQKYITVKVLQSFGNCPKYIQSKTFITNVNYNLNLSTETSLSIDNYSLNLIKEADTFFIASNFNDEALVNNQGADISHRGGKKGFVCVNEMGQLLVEDYLGNGFFNTLGNLMVNPVASLLFCDWRRGHILQILVSSRIIWRDDSNTKDFLFLGSKSDRIICFTPLQFSLKRNGLAYLQVNAQ